MAILERATAGQSDLDIVAALHCSIWTVRKWRRIGQRQGRAGLAPPSGRPPTGPLGSIAPALREAILNMRRSHPGWGAVTILAELRTDPLWADYRLPSRARIAALFKHATLTRRSSRHTDLPEPVVVPEGRPHDVWELDAQRPVVVEHLYEWSDNLPKKRAYLQQAGERAARRFANDAAVDYLTRALTVTPATDLAARYTLLRARAQVEDLQAARSAQRQDVEALTRLAELLDDDERRSEAAAYWSRYAEQMGDYTQAIPLARQAVTLAQQAHHLALEGAAQFQLGRNLFRSGDYAAASTPLEQSLQLARTLGDQLLESNVLGSLGAFVRSQGDNAGAAWYYEQSISLARASGQRQREGVSLHDLGLMAAEVGDYASAQSYLEQSVRIFRAIGDRATEASALSALVVIAIHQGNRIAAQSYFEQGLQLCRATGELREEIWVFGNFGWAMQCVGDYDTARAYYEQSLLLAHAKRLRDYPKLGRPGRVEGSRELVISGTPFLLVYDDNPVRVEILHVYDGRQDWQHQPL